MAFCLIEDSATQLCSAIQSGDITDVQLVLECGADVNVADENGETPLHAATFNNLCDIVQELLDAGADMDAQNKYSEMTALHLASRSGHTWLVKLLLEQGANMDVLDTIKKKPEFYAANEEIRQLFATHRKFRTTDNVPQDLEAAMDHESGHVNHSMAFSKRHKKLMRMNVFDRLTRQKTMVKK